MIDTLAFINPLIGWMAQPWGRFIVSTAITVLGALIVLALIHKVPKNDNPTWSQSMLGAVVVFGYMLVIYGVWPHDWLTLADSKLNWRSDTFIITEPIKVPWQALRDVIAVGLYAVALTANALLWVRWQNRDKYQTKQAPVEGTPEPAGTSRFGRPLSRLRKA
ncbi:MAG: hypothetical protein KDB86_01340 [Actinobacteria bacterium]|nr:hypothetical protein [Actinomycetota bacterium]